MDPSALLRNAIKRLLQEAENAASQLQGGVLILSDRYAGSGRIIIPDLIAVAAVRKHLENKNLSHKVSIVADSFQIIGPHHVTALLTVGAQTSGKNTYEQIRLAMGLPNNKPRPFKALLAPTLFAKSMGKTKQMKGSNSAPELCNEVVMKTSNSAPELCKNP